ncbi:RNA polymerase sigma factor [Streptomyces sp. bgisy060]|uniref:RNA polymerase sigma factor n=1 Tax=Streptomyces sp. bgisy060 TaxID=3413775 RepID=UPI003EBBCD76
MSQAYDLGTSSSIRLTEAAAARLDRLFRLYNSRLLGFAVSQTRDHATAEDVVSETWLRAARSLDQLQAEDAKAYGWLRSIAFRAAVDVYRPKSSTEKATDFGDVVAVRLVPATPPADVDLYALAELSAPQATAVKLAAQGLSVSAIAARMGRCHGTASNHLHRGVRKLRKAA